MECVELAIREGFPTDNLTKLQVAKAKVRLARLNQADPLVIQCKEAIRKNREARN